MSLLSPPPRSLLLTHSSHLSLSIPLPDVDELGLHRVQRMSVLRRGVELQLVVSHLLRPLQPLLDHPEAAAGTPLLPALPRHPRHCTASQVPTGKAGNRSGSLNGWSGFTLWSRDLMHPLGGHCSGYNCLVQEKKNLKVKHILHKRYVNSYKNNIISEVVSISIF